MSGAGATRVSFPRVTQAAWIIEAVLAIIANALRVADRIAHRLT